MKRTLITGTIMLTTLAALAGCITSDSMDRSDAYAACQSQKTEAARDACIKTNLAVKQAEREQAGEDFTKSEREYEDRAARERAMGVPDDQAGRRPGDDMFPPNF